MWEASFSAIVHRAFAALAWAPGWLPSLLVLVVPAVVALAVHGLVMRLVTRLISPNRVFLRTFIARTLGPTRVLLVLLVVGPAVPAAGFSDATSAFILHTLLIAFILVLGWSAMIAVGLGADLYLRRFRVDVDDNLRARKHLTQVRILSRASDTLIFVITVSMALMTIPAVRQYGVSLFASAGAAGIILGLAARPLLSNLIAGIQIAVTQPIRLEDVVIVEGEWGWVEEIASTFVVIRTWDLRRLIVPLSYFMEKPFQNWTYSSASLIGSVYLYVDWTVPVDRLREALETIVHASQRWDQRTVVLQVTDVTKEGIVELRALVSARNSSLAWDLRCEVREKLMVFLREEFPQALPRSRVDLSSESRPESPPIAPTSG